MAEFKLDKIRFTWKGDWTTSIFYTKDDIVRYGGKSYVCLVGHTASSNFYTDLNYINTATEPDIAAPKWTLWFDGYAWKSSWNYSTFYNQGDVVRFNGYLYLCITSHTSTANINSMSGLTTDSSNWSVYLKTDYWTGEWIVTTAYQKGDIARYGGTIYRCIITHQSDPLIGFPSWGWEIVTQGIDYKSSWASSTVYKAYDLVKYGANIWKCTTDHTSASTFTPANWTIYVPGVTFRNNWNNATSYIPGDIVGYGGYNYTSNTHNTNSVPSTHLVDWTLVTKGFRIQGDWSSATQYYVGDVVRRNGYVYVSIADNLNLEPASNVSYWTTLITGTQWNNRWVVGTSYLLGDIVIYKSIAYLCILAHTASSGNNPISGIGVQWNTLISGDANEPMTTIGDTLTYNIVNTALPIGTSGNVLKSSGTMPYWGDFGGITVVYYVAPNGTDTVTSGTTLANPFLTIKYACDFIRGLAVPSATLFIKTGIYTETLPIIVAAGLELVGDEIRSTVVQPASGYTTSNMFYVRNGSGIRNMTLTGLSGSLGTANIYGTSRPTAGAYVSLDPGSGTNDSSVWITTKSPYVQNVSTFGTGCTGLKIDGTLHNGGNKSVVANDFTQILSDGIGVWCTGSSALVELVSVFSYYGHIGYLAENGGKIRATNGNSSYGTYGTVSEGYDSTETPLAGTVNNRNQSAQVASVFAGQAQNKILAVEYSNAGQNYSLISPPTFTFGGAGTNVSTLVDEYRDGAVFEAMITGTDANAGGFGYLTAGNQAQGGTSTTIVIASNDTNLAANYIGMRVIINSGTGVGQYGYVQAYNSLSKTISVYKESTGTAGWDHVVPGTTIATTLDSTTVYSIEPCVTFTTPTFALGSTGTPTNANSITYGNGKFVVVGGSGTGVMQYSSNGTSWTTGTGSVAFNNPSVAFAAASNTFVGINASGSTYGYSANGTLWTAGTLPTSATNSSIISASTNVAYISYSGSTRTNLLTYSENFSTWNTSLPGISSNATTAPDGTTTGTLFTSSITSQSVWWNYTINTNDTTIRTFSVFLKPGTVVSTGIVMVYTGSASSYIQCQITWSTLSVTSQNTAGNVSVSTPVAVGNGWYRLSVTGSNLVAANTFIQLQIQPAYTGTGTCYVWGAQLETGTRASGYIQSVATQGTATTELLTSSDGTTWNALGCPAGNFKYLAYGTGVYIASTGTNTNTIGYSYNGITWTNITLPETNYWSAIAYGNGRFVITNTNGYSSSFYSLDGITWTRADLPTSGYWSITYGQGMFIAVSGTNGGCRSTDGINWTSFTPGAFYNYIAIGNPSNTPRFVAVSSTGSLTGTVGTPALGRVTVGSGKIGSIKLWNPGSGYPATPTTAQFVASVNGTILSLTLLNLGSIVNGMVLYGGRGNVAANTVITGQNNVTFVGFINGTILTVTSVSVGSMAVGLVLTNSGVVTGTTVISSDTAVFNGTIAGSTLTVTTMGSGIIYPGMVLTGGALPAGLYIVSNISGAGTNSTWQVSQSGSYIVSNINGIRYQVDTSQTIAVGSTFGGTSYNISISQTLATANFYASLEPGAIATITDPNASSTVVINCRVGNGVLGNPSFINRGNNYQTSTTTCTITGGAGYADIYPVSKYLTVSNLSYSPSLGASLTIGANQTQYKIVNVTNLTGGTYYLQISPSISRSITPAHGTAIAIRQKYSQVRLTGHDYLLIGTGNKTTSNYPNTDITTAKSYNQVMENNLGRVFVTATDQDGNFKVGNLFGVQQATGTVTISADLFNLSGLNQITLGGVQVGQNTVTITQFSTDPYFVANSDNIVPTQKAIKSYIANQISNGGANAQTSIITAGTVGVGPFSIFSSAGTSIKINNKMNMTKGVDGVMLALAYFKSSRR